MTIEGTTIIVKGASMNPRLKDGDLVRLRPLCDYHPGDIVVFSYKDEGYLVHRVISVQKNRLLCKGDNSFRLEFVSRNNVIGKVISVKRGGIDLTKGYIDINNINIFIDLAFKVHKVAEIYNYNIEKIIKDVEYQKYKNLFLNVETNFYHIVLHILRSIFKKGLIDTAHLSKNILADTLRIFRRHNITELLSKVNGFKEFNLDAVSRVKRVLNKSAYQVLYNMLPPIISAIDFPYAIIKGLPLAKAVYKDESYSGSSEINILIDKQNLQDIISILERQGFVQGYLNKNMTISKFTRKQMLFYLNSTNQVLPYIKPNTDERIPFICININFAILWGKHESQSIEIKDFLSDTVKTTYGSVDFYTLSIEKAFIQYCLHNYKEHSSLYLLSGNKSISLRRFCDVYSLVKKENINTDLVIKIAKLYDIEKYIYYTLYYTALVFDDKSILEPYQELEIGEPGFLDRFGLAESEYNTWPIPFLDRLFCEDRFSVIKPLLSQDNIKNIEYNRKYLQGEGVICKG